MATPDEEAPPPTPPPSLPRRLPLDLQPDHLLAWIEALNDLPSDECRVMALRDEMKANRALTGYLRGWQRYFGGRWYMAGCSVGDLARAAGVSDTYISRQIRKYGLKPRRPNRRRRT